MEKLAFVFVLFANKLFSLLIDLRKVRSVRFM